LGNTHEPTFIINFKLQEILVPGTRIMRSGIGFSDLLLCAGTDILIFRVVIGFSRRTLFHAVT
jgi:hypothetical protein